MELDEFAQFSFEKGETKKNFALAAKVAMELRTRHSRTPTTTRSEGNDLEGKERAIATAVQATTSEIGAASPGDYRLRHSGERYASKVGSAALNQKLSTERAENLTNFLEREGRIPLTDMLAPGAMGTSKQVAPDSTTEGQAENRRVVVRVLQIKAIAGT